MKRTNQQQPKNQPYALKLRLCTNSSNTFVYYPPTERVEPRAPGLSLSWGESIESETERPTNARFTSKLPSPPYAHASTQCRVACSLVLKRCVPSTPKCCRAGPCKKDIAVVSSGWGKPLWRCFPHT